MRRPVRTERLRVQDLVDAFLQRLLAPNILIPQALLTAA
jgi:hypothetical protein